MYTNCELLTMTDYQDSVINNLIANIGLNKTNHKHLSGSFEPSKNRGFDMYKIEFNYCLGCFPSRHSLIKLDWREYEKFKLESFDFVIGTELIWQGGLIEELAKMIYNLLKPCI